MTEYRRRIRWRLARWLAPEPIMADPCPGREAFVVQRSERGKARWQVSVPLDKLDIKIEKKTPWEVESNARVTFNRVRRLVTVTGSAES